MIKGSTKVGEVFICGKETNGGLQVLPQYLGKAIIGLGGGNDQLYVIQKDEGFLGRMNAVMPELANLNEQAFRNNTHEKFGMTPFG